MNEDQGKWHLIIIIFMPTILISLILLENYWLTAILIALFIFVIFKFIKNV
ncbi:MAG: hypothetical protein HKN39_05370 [Flavobacteriales bacterium]|nr:hypothetical protein [Flavobacteriales bacterium]